MPKILEQAGHIHYRPIFIHSSSKNILNNIIIVLKYIRLYKQIRPDVVLSFTIKPNIFSTFACQWLGIPTINQVTGLGNIFIYDSAINWLLRRLYVYSQKHAAMLLFQNEHDRRVFSEISKHSEHKTEQINGPGVDLVKYSRHKPYQLNDTFIFIFIGRLITDKGLYELIGAAKKLINENSKIELHILGQQDPTNKNSISEKELIALISDYPSIRYFGFQENPIPFLENSNALILPSYREGTGKVLLEGMAMNLPLIAADVPGCNVVVKDGVNGFLCAVKNPYDLSEKMKKLLKMSEDELKEMGSNGRWFVVQNYNEDAIIARYEKFISEIVTT